MTATLLRQYMSLCEDRSVDPIKALRASEQVMNMGAYVSEGGIGFLLPDGSFLTIDDSHNSVAHNAGTSMSDLYHAGVARIYLTSDFLGIEIWQSPTRHQIAFLMKAMRDTKSIERFAVEGAYDINLGGDNRPVTSPEVRDALMRMLTGSSENHA